MPGVITAVYFASGDGRTGDSSLGSQVGREGGREGRRIERRDV